MLNDNQRHALNELERQLEHDDPAWARQFITFTPRQRDHSPTTKPTTVKHTTVQHTSATLTISIVIAAVLMLLGLVLGNPQIFLTFCGAALILTFIRLYS
jgi:ABC-type dipeptide/oligopeptide/nickel transport system permease component